METKIERYELITVQTAQPNQYGDLLVNGTYKVGKKRSSLFEVFQVGTEVKLGYASYLNKEYIATAEQTGKHEVNHLVEAAKNLGAVPVDDIRTDGYKPPLAVPESKSTPTPAVMTPELWDAKEARTRKSIERQKALELAVNFTLSYAEKIEDLGKEVLRIAKRFEKYLESGE
jgi:hypothetical protein